MKVNKMNRCSRCMKELDAESTFCPDCGYDQRKGNSERALPVGTILNGKYCIGAVIGEGGFGITYAAWDMMIGTRIAIKEYFPSEMVTRNTTLLEGKAACNLTLIQETAGENRYREGLEKFVKEAENLAKFQKHQGIVSVKDFFYENNTAYMVMEYIDGVTLNSYLASRNGKLSTEDAFRMMEPVMKTLEAIHKEGVIHRDISPDNIMVTTDGQMKLIDFGAARFVGTDGEKSLTIILKHGYAPDEQYRSNGEQGPWTDVYALSAVIYRMLTGKTPEETLKRMMEKQDSVHIELGNIPGLPTTAKKSLEKGLAVKADRRYRTIGALYEGIYSTDKHRRNLRKLTIGTGITAAVLLCWFFIGSKNKEVDETIAVTKSDILKDIHMTDDVRNKNKAGIEIKAEMENETELTDIPEEPSEPENIRKLREYYNENCLDKTGNVYFVDLSGDGEDEMIVTETSPVEEYYTQYGLTVYQYQNGIVNAIYVIFQSTQSAWKDGGIDYYLCINEDSSLLARHWKKKGTDERKSSIEKDNKTLFLEKISFKQADNGMIEKIETSELTQEDAMEQWRHSFLLIGLSSYEDLPGNRGKKLENYQKVLENKEGISSAIEIAKNAGKEVLDYTVVYDNEISCTFAVTGELGEFLANVPATVWALYDGHIEKAEILDGDVNLYEDVILPYQLCSCDTFQFGNSHHFFVSTRQTFASNAWPVQHKFCFEDGQIREIEEEHYFIKDKKGKIQINVDGYLKVFGEKNSSVTGQLDYYYVDMFYYNGQYVEYGAEQVDNDVIEQYENYNEVLQTVEEEFLKGATIGIIRMGNMDYTVDRIELDHIRKAANNVYYLNYRVYGTTPFWDRYTGEGEELNLWAHAVLEATGRRLEFKEIVWTKKEEESGLGFPLYYGADR